MTDATRSYRFAVNVTPKPGILDPQGRAVERSLPHLGIEGASAVRVVFRQEAGRKTPPERCHLSPRAFSRKEVSPELLARRSRDALAASLAGAGTPRFGRVCNQR